jgi:hypothetical protein
VFGQRREINLRDAQILECDGAQHLVDLSACGGEDDPEGFTLRIGGLDGQRRPELELIVCPRLTCGW